MTLSMIWFINGFFLAGDDAAPGGGDDRSAADMCNGAADGVEAEVAGVCKNCTKLGTYLIVEVGSSEILKAKQKLGVTFNFNK